MARTQQHSEIVTTLEKVWEEYKTWDIVDDIYSHLQREMNKVSTESRTKRLKYLDTLFDNVEDQGCDPEIKQFRDGLYVIVKCQMLHLQQPNRNNTSEEDPQNMHPFYNEKHTAEEKLYIAEENCTEEDDETMLADPQYEDILGNLRPIGNFYALDVPEKHVFVEYHHDHEAENVNLVSNEANVGSKTIVKNSNGIGNSVASNAEKHVPVCKGKRRSRKQKGSQIIVKNSNVSGNSVASQAEKHSSLYKLKLRSSTQKGSNHKGGYRIKYIPSSLGTIELVEIEDSDDDDDDTNGRGPGQNLHLNGPYCDDNEANARILTGTGFRERLIEELKRPYCEEEYKTLFEEITFRSQVQGTKELRGVTKTYEGDRLGKSLLDHHINLKRKIALVRDDRPKVLNLLRGLRFWVINSSHEGAFMPWKDQSCLNVLPQQWEGDHSF